MDGSCKFVCLAQVSLVIRLLIRNNKSMHFFLLKHWQGIIIS